MTLFSVTEPPVTPPRRNTATAARYVNAASNARCDHCTAALIEHGGAGPLARAARIKRVDVDGAVELLCYAHAQQLRDLESLVDKRGVEIVARPKTKPASSWNDREESTWIDRM